MYIPDNVSHTGKTDDGTKKKKAADFQLKWNWRPQNSKKLSTWIQLITLTSKNKDRIKWFNSYLI